MSASEENACSHAFDERRMSIVSCAHDIMIVSKEKMTVSEENPSVEGEKPVHSDKNPPVKSEKLAHSDKNSPVESIRTDYVHEQQAHYRTAIAGLENQTTNAGAGERVKLNKQLKKLQYL